MLWKDDTSDPQDLRTYIRDLIALSALPAIWKEYQPQQIAESLADALLAVLSADFVYVSLPSASNHQSVEVIRVDSHIPMSLVSAAETFFRHREGRVEQETSISDSVEESRLWLLSTPVGVAGTVAAGSLSPDFINNKHRLLLASSAGDLTIALNRGRSGWGDAPQTDHAAEIAAALARVEELSPRGREILEALASGHPNKVIAFDLGISERTVEVHRSRIMKQLGVHHLFEAIRIAVLAGLAPTG